MHERVLITGGAGFIGSHLVDRLVELGYRVRVLDSLEPQVHGDSAGHRNGDAEYQVGSVLDADAVARSLRSVDAVVHFAAQVGVDQSMYDIRRYVRENCEGTAVLLEALAQRRSSVGTLLVASSMSIYGEGQYRCLECDREDASAERPPARLEVGLWELICAHWSAPTRLALVAPLPAVCAWDIVYITARVIASPRSFHDKAEWWRGRWVERPLPALRAPDRQSAGSA